MGGLPQQERQEQQSWVQVQQRRDGHQVAHQQQQ